jgi:hypothetical protein
MLQKLTLGGRHSLREFLGQHVWRHFFRDVHVEDPQVASYVADVLVDFAWIDNLYRIRNALGKRLEDVGEMLLESNPLLAAGSFDRERAVRKHVGDYTLFMTGLFPETVARIRKASPPRLESFVDFVKAGKESYAIVSSFDQFEYRHEAPLFRKLSENFELCVYALNLVKQDLERYQAQYYNGLKEVVGESGLT